MTRPSAVRPRVAAAALAATACLLGGAASAQAAPAPAGSAGGPSRSVEATESAQFTAGSAGGSQETAVNGAVTMAYLYAQGAGWQRSQCYVLGFDVRSAGIGWYSARATVLCMR
ncbi:hypothetical protein [Kitasatospora sp. NPDC015120]|uniref:hypothetical protein n=1 Tax=Kitasatospora sp. NPDC015120 TaxID=3364023 RepID=UPI0036F49799